MGLWKGLDMYLDLRTKKSIQEGIQWREQKEDGSEVVCYCPGDGTRYVLVIMSLAWLSEASREKLGVGVQGHPLMITLASDPGNARSFATYRGSFVHYDYIQEKLGTTLASSVTLAEFIGWLIDGKAWSCDEAREHFSDS